jgi:hypothetical protein
MWQMIPHHENAVNMAKLLLKEDVLDTAGDRRALYEAAKKAAADKGRRLDTTAAAPTAPSRTCSGPSSTSRATRS